MSNTCSYGSSMSKQLLAKVAHYYYRDRLTMAEIGLRLGLSRHKVGRLLQEATETGVVHIEIRAPESTDADLEGRLEAAFGLKACFVVSVDEAQAGDAIKRQTCEVGASFLFDLLKEDDTIGVGWGSTTFELVSHLRQYALPDCKVVQITGGNKWVNAHFDCHEVTRRLADRLGVRPIVLHAPGIVDKKETRDLLVDESSIGAVFSEFHNIDIAIVGIGSLLPQRASALLDSGYISNAEAEALERAGAVADVFSYFVDDAGGVVPSNLNDRTLTIGIEDIRKIPTLLGVATGAHKAQAVRAVVRGGFVNTLIIDSGLAKALLALPTECGDDDRKADRSGETATSVQKTYAPTATTIRG